MCEFQTLKRAKNKKERKKKMSREPIDQKELNDLFVGGNVDSIISNNQGNVRNQNTGEPPFTVSEIILVGTNGKKYSVNSEIDFGISHIVIEAL